MMRVAMLTGFLGLSGVGLFVVGAQEAPEVDVYKSPT